MSAPAIILVNPQLGENIGAAARVMGNFGLSDLRIVSPRDGWPNPRARPMSAGAFDENVVKATVFDKLEEAIADLSLVLATTARPRGVVKPVTDARGAAEACTQYGERFFLAQPCTGRRGVLPCLGRARRWAHD